VQEVNATKTMRDIMSAAPVCMAPGESALAAARAMRRHATGTVLVLAGGRLRGLVTERAVRRTMVLQDGAPVGVVSAADLALDPDPALCVRPARP